MSDFACTAKDIFSINESKEYVLTSSALLERVLTDKNLSSQSASLWQILYNLCKFDADLSITISYQNLSKKLGKSPRTIMRYVSNLVQFGYLIVTENYTEDKTQLSNTFKVRFPMDYMKKIKYFNKDRHIKTEAKQDVPEIDYSSDYSYNNYGDEDSDSYFQGLNEAQPNNVISLPEPKQFSKTCNLISGEPKERLAKNVVPSKKVEEVKKVESGREEREVTLHQEWGDNLDMRESDKNVIHNTRERDLNITTVLNENSVVVSESLKKQMQKTENHETKIEAIKTKLRSLGNSLEDCEKAGRLESELQFLINTHETQTQKQNTHDLLTDEAFIQQLPCERRLSEKQFAFLKTELSRFRSGMDVLITLNQIAYSICSGEMRYKKGTIEELDIDIAITYALRFVKANTWQEPNSLKKFLKGLVKA